MRVGWVNQVLQAPCTEPETLRHAEQPHCVGNKNGINSAAENRLNQPFFHHPRLEVTVRRQRFPVMLSPKERQALQTLAGEEGLSSSAIVRRLIHQEARKRGLWAPPRQHNTQPQPTPEARPEHP